MAINFFSSLNKYGDNIAAIADSGESITYNTIADYIERFRGIIKDRCLVFSLCTNTIGSLVGYVGFLSNRIIPLLLNKDMDQSLLESLIRIYKPAFIWLPEKARDTFLEYEAVYCCFGYTLLKTNMIGTFELYNELALLLTTSGSTGSPKLVRQSYENIYSNTKSIAKYLALDETERPITTLPMNYTYGLSIINSHLYTGACLLLTDKSIVEKEFWAFFKDRQATSFGGVPYTYEMLDKFRFARMDIPSLKTMTQAGGKLSVELQKKFVEYAKSKDKRFIVMYGATEATARMSYLPFEKSEEKYGSIGIAIPGGEFKIIDNDGNDVNEPDIVGELVYEGANVTLGYAETGSDLAKGDERKGRLVTGDMVKRDIDGYFYIVGRKKRFLKVFGNRVNLDEIERMVRDAFPDVDCACSGKDDALFLFVTDISIKSEAVRFISAKTGLNPIAFHVKEIKEIPKSEAGKTLYRVLESYVD